MILYGLSTCDSCRKILKVLRNSGFEPEFVDVRSDGVPGPELERFHAAFGAELLNKQSTTWRGLNDEDRKRPQVALISAYPTLMKRPVIEEGARLTLGWSADTAAMWLAVGAGV